MPLDRALVNTVFGKVLKGVARENDKTQQAIADHLGQNVVTINRIFGGKRDITVLQFLQITAFCGEDADLILRRAMAKIATVSDAPDNVIPLKRVTEMDDEEVDELRGVAGHDPELEQDEPEAP